MTGMNDDNPYPDDTTVLARYPRSQAEQQAVRNGWPWVNGVIAQRVGTDEWQVCVEVAQLEDGTPAPAGTPDDDLWFPACYRDASEIKQPSLGQ